MSKQNEKALALKEIHETLKLCNFCIRRIGLSFMDDLPKTFSDKLRVHVSLVISLSLVVLVVAGEVSFVVAQVVRAVNIAEFVNSNLHIAGYGCMSLGKLLTLWYQKNTFRKLVGKLEKLWPVSIKDEEALDIKRTSLSALKQRQLLYAFWNFLGVLFYTLTPICTYVYNSIIGTPGGMGFVWQLAYPFDKTKPVTHGFVYVFEACAGTMSVFCMLGSDLFFMTMASHISMLLRLLQQQIRRMGKSYDNITMDDIIECKYIDCYDDIVAVIRIHQSLIRYINDLENAFAVVNLINVLLSSINICLVMFVIVFLEPWVELSNKFFLGAVLTQMGIVCWYADDIYRASVGVADAVYDSCWYISNTNCRRAMLVVLERSQKPLYFTAWKFSPITLTTYSSILTSAYSYFTLLYTSYRGIRV